MRSRPSSRRRDLAPGGWCREPLEPLISLSLAGYGSRFVSEEFRTVDEHSVQNHPASLRATATLALRMPARAATRIPQLFRSEPLTGRVRMTLAAS